MSPRDLPRQALLASLSDGWGIDPAAMTYQPVGFGSHHWLATAADRRWFVTVDDLAARRRAAEEPFDTADSTDAAPHCRRHVPPATVG